ncbi:MAG: hypothetical protein ACRDL1_02570 [Solirubrobacterales bacterium]
MQTARNVAIIAVLALGVAAIPGGGTAAETVLAALVMGFLAAMGFLVYRLYWENQLTLSTLTDAQRAVLYGAIGVIALMIAGADELLDSGLGTLIWIALIALSALAIFRVWTVANTY